MRAKIVSVIVTDTPEGKGTPEDPVCMIRRYWTTDGKLISKQIYMEEGVETRSQEDSGRPHKRDRRQ